MSVTHTSTSWPKIAGSDRFSTFNRTVPLMKSIKED